MIPLGIKKIDKLIGGGVPEGFNILFTGMPGTGKSLFVHKIVYSLLERGYYVIFITTDRSPEQLVREVGNLDMNYKKYIRNKHLIIIDVYAGEARVSDNSLSADIRDLTSVSLLIDKVASELKGKKVVQVYDVLTELFIWTRKDELILRFVSNACARSRADNSLSIFVVNEGMQKEEYLNSIEAITQATIKLGITDDKRWLSVKKFQGAPVSTKRIYFRINPKNGKISFLRK